MGRYKKISQTEGRRLLSLIWTINLCQDADYFVNPFSNRRLRYRSIIRKIPPSGEKILVYFHLSPQEGFPDLNPLPKTIYLYGAFNQINVYQVRCRGNIREMKPNEQKSFIRNVLARLIDHQDIGDKLRYKPSVQEEIKEASLINEGKYYLFEPLEYALGSYERG